MKYIYRSIVLLISIVVLWSCTSGDSIVDYSELTNEDLKSEKTSGYNEDRNVYFGDLHVHTKHSFDAYIFGTTATPDDAYKYAKGGSIQHPLGYEMQLREPLDFYAVTDHGFLMGNVEWWADPNNTTPGTEAFTNLNTPENRTVESIPRRGALFATQVRNLAAGGFNLMGTLQYWWTGDQARVISIYDVDKHRSAWKDVIRSAQEHNDPGNFTTFVAYEYTTSTTRSGENISLFTPDGTGPFEGGNLHRNVIFNGNRFTVEPFSRLDSLNPEDLWTWMDELRDQGVDTIAIPHNSNGSNGQMFELEDWAGYPVGNEYAEFRMRNEPLVEVTQVKGTSDTHPLLSPNDEWADFEIMDTRVGGTQWSKPDGSYVRQAYLAGLTLQEEERGNPYKFGLVGASDTHTGAISDDESDFHSKIGILDGTSQARGSVPLSDDQVKLISDNDDLAGARLIGLKKIDDTYYSNPGFRQWSASGLAVVWAEENTRDSIFSAFRRKETYATSGSRIKLRFFGGENLSQTPLSDKDLVTKAYSSGVPMGGDLTGLEESPEFLVWAVRDARGAPLQRIQIIKGFVENAIGDPLGRPNEQVYDVACSDGLKVDPNTHRCPDNGANVNLTNCSISSNVGASELKTYWKDPDFDSSQKAFYYVRVLENPTCRWSTWDAIKNGTQPRPDLHKTVQERAWSTPIWHTPEA
tara:strand:- start:19563 stop:21638 length:2076 start_codon:yes stop_codon:yes gene_type:complete